MNQIAITPNTDRHTDHRSVASTVEWLRDLEECRVGGLLSDEDYFVQRAEKLSEILCEHRYLWVAPIASSGLLSLFVGAFVVAWRGDSQLAAVAAALGGLFGLVVLARPCRDMMKQAQIRDRLQILSALLAMDLLTAEEFLAYEERLHRGGRSLHLVGSP